MHSGIRLCGTEWDQVVWYRVGPGCVVHSGTRLCGAKWDQVVW